MIDNETGKAVRVNFAPLPLEMILRSRRRDAPLLLGYLQESLLEAARRLWPEITPLVQRKSLMTPRREFDPLPHEDKTLPVWRRPRGQGLAEYALILALIAIVSIVALIFLGAQISGFLDQVGQSI